MYYWEKLQHAANADKSNLTAKKDFIALKDEVDKLGINKLVNVPNGLNDLKTNLDKLNVNKLKTFPINFKELIM